MDNLILALELQNIFDSFLWYLNAPWDVSVTVTVIVRHRFGMLNIGIGCKSGIVKNLDPDQILAKARLQFQSEHPD